MHNTFRYGQGTRDMAGPEGLTTEKFINKVLYTGEKKFSFATPLLAPSLRLFFAFSALLHLLAPSPLLTPLLLRNIIVPR